MEHVRLLGQQRIAELEYDAKKAFTLSREVALAEIARENARTAIKMHEHDVHGVAG